MSKYNDAVKSKGSISLIGPLDDLKRHVKVKGGKVEFTPPPDLEAPYADTLQRSVKALNDYIAKGLVTVNANGDVEVSK